MGGLDRLPDIAAKSIAQCSLADASCAEHLYHPDALGIAFFDDTFQIVLQLSLSPVIMRGREAIGAYIVNYRSRVGASDVEVVNAVHEGTCINAQVKWIAVLPTCGTRMICQSTYAWAVTPDLALIKRVIVTNWAVAGTN